MRKFNSSGFTLIEVVLVLALGGLIFLLAFIAFGTVSQNRRDTQRRSDASKIISEIQNYIGDSNGSLPASSVNNEVCTGVSGSFGSFMGAYVCQNGKIISPLGTYTVVESTSQGMVDSTPIDSIMYTQNYDCTGSAVGEARVQIRLETGIACRDSR